MCQIIDDNSNIDYEITVNHEKSDLTCISNLYSLN